MKRHRYEGTDSKIPQWRRPCKHCGHRDTHKLHATTEKNRRLTETEYVRAQKLLAPLIENEIPFETTRISDLTEIAAELMERGNALLTIATGRIH